MSLKREFEQVSPDDGRDEINMDEIEEVCGKFGAGFSLAPKRRKLDHGTRDCVVTPDKYISDGEEMRGEDAEFSDTPQEELEERVQQDDANTEADAIYQITVGNYSVVVNLVDYLVFSGVSLKAAEEFAAGTADLDTDKRIRAFLREAEFDIATDDCPMDGLPRTGILIAIPQDVELADRRTAEDVLETLEHLENRIEFLDTVDVDELFASSTNPVLPEPWEIDEIKSDFEGKIEWARDLAAAIGDNLTAEQRRLTDAVANSWILRQFDRLADGAPAEDSLESARFFERFETYGMVAMPDPVGRFPESVKFNGAVDIDLIIEELESIYSGQQRGPSIGSMYKFNQLIRISDDDAANELIIRKLQDRLGYDLVDELLESPLYDADGKITEGVESFSMSQAAFDEALAAVTEDPDIVRMVGSSHAFAGSCENMYDDLDLGKFGGSCSARIPEEQANVDAIIPTAVVRAANENTPHDVGWTDEATEALREAAEHRLTDLFESAGIIVHGSGNDAIEY